MTLLKLVTEQTSKPEVRDIRGINLRLMQLDSHLRSLERRFKFILPHGCYLHITVHWRFAIELGLIEVAEVCF